MNNPTTNIKNQSFEYLVFLLEQWRNELGKSVNFTKLRLQKILFFAVAINATNEDHPLLDIFNRFYAMPYGPVELDIYESMKANGFTNLNFSGIECQTNFQSYDASTLDSTIREELDAAVNALKDMDFNYILAPVYSLVEITHRWSAWRIAMDISNFSGSRQEPMTTEDICNSVIKAFS